eukprot:COSAG02_NODE_7037_length_3215_cov_18.415276_2_plen_48_part_00
MLYKASLTNETLSLIRLIRNKEQPHCVCVVTETQAGLESWGLMRVYR